MFQNSDVGESVHVTFEYDHLLLLNISIDDAFCDDQFTAHTEKRIPHIRPVRHLTVSRDEHGFEYGLKSGRFSDLWGFGLNLDFINYA